MSDSKQDNSDLKGLPDPEFRTKKRRISIVWLVPLVALAIGGWLVYKALSEKGPIITISFDSAAGLEAGKPSPKKDRLLPFRSTRLRGWRPARPRSGIKMSNWARSFPSIWMISSPR